MLFSLVKLSVLSDAVTCVPCPLEYKSNGNRTRCELKNTEFLTFKEVMGNVLVTFSLCGGCLTVTVGLVFFYHRRTGNSKSQQLRAELPAALLTHFVFSLFSYFHWSAH